MKSYFILILLYLPCSAISQEQGDSTISLFQEKVKNVRWMYSNKPVIDSLKDANPHNYMPPHGGATTVRIAINDTTVAIASSGPSTFYNFCSYYLTLEDDQFKIELHNCEIKREELPRYIYGKILDKNVLLAFTDKEYILDDNLNRLIGLDKNVNWLKFTMYE